MAKRGNFSSEDEPSLPAAHRYTLRLCQADERTFGRDAVRDPEVWKLQGNSRETSGNPGGRCPETRMMAKMNICLCC